MHLSVIYLVPLLLFNNLLYGQIDSVSLIAEPSDHSQETKKKIRKWKRSDWIIPLTLVGSGAIICMDKSTDSFFLNDYDIQEERNKHFANFYNEVDNYIQYAPTLMTFTLSLSKIKGRMTCLTRLHFVQNQNYLCLL